VIVQIDKFIWAISSCGGHLTADAFVKHYELHYRQKKITLDGSDNTLSAQFGCITFHPSRYLMEAPHSCAGDDANGIAFKEATKIIGGHNAVEEFLACGI
jgi:hypothetical protein